MSCEIVVDPNTGILRARYSGEMSLDDRVACARRVLEEAERSGCYRLLLDFRAAHARVAKLADAVRMADEVTPRLRPGARLAYLMTYDHQIDDSVGTLIRSRGVQVDRFIGLEDAVAWLQADVLPGNQAGPSEGGSSRAHRLIADAIDPATSLSPHQLSALGELVEELLDRDIDDAAIRSIAVRIAEAMAPT